jgi:adenylyltransferase/sulfurtransferase
MEISLRDLFPEPQIKRRSNCNLNGVLGTLPGIIGTMMAQETLKLIMDLPTLENELVLFNTLDWSLRTEVLNANCCLIFP